MRECGKEYFRDLDEHVKRLGMKQMLKKPKTINPRIVHLLYVATFCKILTGAQ